MQLGKLHTVPLRLRLVRRRRQIRRALVVMVVVRWRPGLGGTGEIDRIARQQSRARTAAIWRSFFREVCGRDSVRAEYGRCHWRRWLVGRQT